MKKLILMIILTGLFLPACKKYQYGPYLSLATKKQRVQGDWQVDSAITTQGVDIGDSFGSYRFQFKKGGEVEIGFLSSSNGQADTVFGEWSLEEEHDLFAWKDLMGDTTGFFYSRNETFDILRLTEKEFWLADKYNTYLYLSQ